MGAYSLKLYFEDVWQLLRCNKRRVFLCVFFALLGIVFGVVLFNTANYNWWYCNRYEFANMLLYGGFFQIFCSFLISAALCNLLLCLFSMCHWTPILCYPLIVVFSLYFGANCAAIFTCVGLVGILYAVLLAVGQTVNLLCCFFVLCVPNCRRTFREAFCATKSIFIWQLVSIIFRIAVLFLLLRFLAGKV